MDEAIPPAILKELTDKGIDPAIFKTGQYMSMPSPGPVPTVDAADLRRVWELMRKCGRLVRVQKGETRLPKAEPEGSAQSSRSYDSASLGLPIPADAGCSPGADVGAVWFRVMMLGWLEGLWKMRYIIKLGRPSSEIADLPDVDYSKPSDAVFKALAVVPMTGLSLSGAPLKEFPVDLREFARLIQKESGEAT